jgi:hypothetical protein
LVIFLKNLSLFVFVLFLCACSKTIPEEAILASIDAMQMAIDERNTGDVVEHVSDNFSGSHNMGRPELRKMIMGMFLRYKNIHVVVTRMDIQHDPRRPGIANMDGIILVTGAQGLVPQDGRLLNVKGEWQEQKGDWVLAQVEWE